MSTKQPQMNQSRIGYHVGAIAHQHRHQHRCKNDPESTPVAVFVILATFPADPNGLSPLISPLIIWSILRPKKVPISCSHGILVP